MLLLRSVVFTLWFFGITTLFCLGTSWLRWRACRHGPAAILAYARMWPRAVRGGLPLLCVTRWRLDGAANLPAPSRGAILAAQYQSTFETLFWTSELADVAFVVKRELFAIPLFDPMLRLGGLIAVDRDGGAATLRLLLHEAEAAAAQQRPIVIVPKARAARLDRSAYYVQGSPHLLPERGCR